MRTLMILLRKEFILFRKTKFLPKVAFIFPCMVILLIPLVATMDVKHVGVEVIDRDNSSLSRMVISDMASSPFFTVTMAHERERALKEIESGRADVILELPLNFEKSLATDQPAMPDISANGVNGVKGTLGASYVAESVMKSVKGYLGTKAVRPGSECVITYLYNPTLEYRYYMIPALMIMLLIMICGFLPALNRVNVNKRLLKSIAKIRTFAL